MIVRLELNPIPWTSGTAGIRRVNGKLVPYIAKDPGLAAYQTAVREQLIAALDGNTSVHLVHPPYKIVFYLWRALEQADVGMDRKRRAHQADATNMQKALEDALQGILIGNDRDVDDIRTVLVEQGPDVEPGIVVQINDSLDKMHLPRQVQEARLDLLDALQHSKVLVDNEYIQEEIPF